MYNFFARTVAFGFFSLTLFNIFYRVKEKGGASNFYTFMESKNITPSIFKLYAGNRFHALYHIAGVAIFRKEALSEYLKR